MGSILVTGGAGFIGSHTVRRLLDEGRRVVVLDNYDPFYDVAIKQRNVAELESRSGFELVEGDIRDRATVDALFARCAVEGVIHLAARAGVRPSIEEPELYTSVNLAGTTTLLEACRRHEVDRFVFGSSSSVYGNNEKVPFSEDDAVDHPVSPYAATKKAGEVLCHAHHHLFGIKVACLRFFTVFGPGQRPDLAIHKFTRMMAEGQEIDQYGDGSSARDYTFVDDIVDGIVRAYDRAEHYHIWNLGNSGSVRLSEMIAKIAAGLGVEPRIRYLPMQPGDVDRTCADISRARRELDWQPRTDFDRGLELFLAWYRDRTDTGSREVRTGGNAS
ncbi:epimerase [Acidobacteria bacterium Mor1]|nr:epimerase [Acidobacteria bacterium Mor1]